MQRSILTLIIGKSGRGKSAAIRNLDPQSTFLINCVGKPLPFQTGLQYVEGDNLFVGTGGTNILSQMQRVSKDDRFKTLVIDDTQYIMASEFMEKAMIKGYEKFTQMAKNIWDILLLGARLRAGLKVYVLAHEDDTSGERKMKTLGKLLDEKLTPEGLATIVLFADVIASEEMRQYVFLTQSDGYANAKSPMGMFPTHIPNDLDLVSKRIDEYYSGVVLADSTLDFGNFAPAASPRRR